MTCLWLDGCILFSLNYLLRYLIMLMIFLFMSSAVTSFNMEIPIFTFLLSRIKLLFFHLIGYFKRALCCFSRRRRDSSEHVMLTGVGVIPSSPAEVCKISIHSDQFFPFQNTSVIFCVSYRLKRPGLSGTPVMTRKVCLRIKTRKNLATFKSI